MIFPSFLLFQELYLKRRTKVIDYKFEVQLGKLVWKSSHLHAHPPAYFLICSCSGIRTICESSPCQVD